jgi:NADPH:quinone reductase-like Zn-dependent oxidoreductase
MSNQAAWIPASKAKSFEVDSAPYPKPAPDEVIIKNAAVAINPVEWKIQVSLGDRVNAFYTGAIRTPEDMLINTRLFWEKISREK